MNNVQKLKEMLSESKFTVVITGAGISNSCGIADMEKMNVLNTIETSLAPSFRCIPNVLTICYINHF